MERKPEQAGDGARRTPHWWSALLLRRVALARPEGMWRRLRRRSQPNGRRHRRRLALALTALGVLLGGGLGVGLAQGILSPANTITVVNGQVDIANNGQCSLIEAIRNANNKDNGRPHTDCAAGNPGGADTIVLPNNGNFTVNFLYELGERVGGLGTPWISGPVTIDGNGSTIHRAAAAPTLRLLAVGAQGALTLRETTISGGLLSRTSDTLSYGGAGIFNEGALTIIDSVIEDNVIENSNGNARGGGIHSIGTLEIRNSTIRNNRAEASNIGRGGGLYASQTGATVLIVDSLISGNVVSGDGGSGGGLNTNPSVTVTIEDSVIRDNTATGVTYGGGGGLRLRGTTTIRGTLISGNAANGPAGGGGGMSAVRGTIVNSTLSGNSSDTLGGGVLVTEDVTLSNSTITGNAPDGVAFGCGDGDKAARLNRSLISGNMYYEVYVLNDHLCATGVVANNFNVVGYNGLAFSVGFSPGATDIVPSVGLAAVLSPLANNGGPTQTHALPANSPALDRAPNSACNAAPVNGVDQRGEPRNANGSGGSSANECDVGAFERQDGGTPPTATNTARPTATNTTRPTATNTIRPTVTNTPPPGATFTPTLTATPPTPVTGGRRVLLPSVMVMPTPTRTLTPPPTWLWPPVEVEPNNAAGEDNGPLGSGIVYTGRANDALDRFYMELPQAAVVVVELRNYPGQASLALLRDEGGTRRTLEVAPAAPWRIEHAIGQPGRLYIEVRTPGMSGQGYELVATWGN